MKRAEEFVYRAVLDGWLEIDSEGCVWRIGRQQSSRWGGATIIFPCKRKRAESKTGNAYLQVRVMFEGIRGIASAHRLVWFHFKGRIPTHLTINHKDGCKLNNHPDNLELATTSEQMQHAIRVLGHVPFRDVERKGLLGERNGAAKLTAKEVVGIRRSKKKGAELARQYKVGTATISRVRNGQLWGRV